MFLEVLRKSFGPAGVVYGSRAHSITLTQIWGNERALKRVDGSSYRNERTSSFGGNENLLHILCECFEMAAC